MQTPDFYWLRQPLISIERLLAVLADGRPADLLRDEKVAEAIRIAWPAIDQHLRANELADPQVAETILKYILRMSTRCTPFGLFAGAGIGYRAATSAFDFTHRLLLPQHRLDTQVLVNLAFELSRQPTIKNSLHYFANRSVHRVGNRLRYTESNWREGQWHYFASEVSAEPHLVTVLGLAKTGATRANLIQAITTDADQAEANGFIDRLIEDGLLVSELLPTPTGSDPLTQLIQQLDRLSPALPTLTHLYRIQALLTEARGSLPPTRAITAVLTEQIGLSLEPGSVLQTDMRIAGGSNQLSGRVLNQLQRTLTALHGLSSYNTGNDELSRFKQRFHARYEEQEVPLLLALDDEVGVGYSSVSALTNPVGDLLGDLLRHTSAEPVPTFQADKLHALRMRLFASGSSASNAPVEITDQDLLDLGTSQDLASDSYYAFGYFLAPSAAEVDVGRFQFVLKALGGPSGFTLMGRFCAVDDELADLVTGHMARQQATEPYRVFAEIVHLPQARTGNVIQRPHLRGYEIPYLTQSDLPTGQQIFPDDLWISVPNGEQVVLRSKRLAKEIVPQLTSAHDHRSGLPIYRFLCDLQFQHNPLSISWHWGALAQARRLPRVQYRNIILHEATWSFTASDLLPTLSDEENIARLRREERLPRLVAIRQGDQELFIDFVSSACCGLFIATLRRLQRIQVIEWLRTPDNCPLQGPDGKLTHEVIIPFTNFPKHPASAKSLSVVSPATQRSFPPGSEWFYLKVYCGPSVASAVLERIRQVASQAVNAGQVTHWFFVRYQDPDPHLRVRFRLSCVDQAGIMLEASQRVLGTLLSSGEVYRLQVDTYHRELERYGDTTIDQTEYIFWHDSQLVSQLLQLELNESSLLSAAFLGIDAYQTAFGLTPSEKLVLCKQMYDGLFNEHGATPNLQKAMAQKYRFNQPLMKRILQQKTGKEETEVEEVTIHRMVHHHHQLIRPYIDFVQSHSFTYDQARRWHYLSSVGHLFINRLFGTNQRTYELLVYHHLYRAHQSIVALESRIR